MFIRNVKKREVKKLRKMLANEGEISSCNYINERNTYVLIHWKIIGFFTYKFEHGLPSLRHFLVKDGYKSMATGRFLIKAYCELMRELGYTKSIIAIKKYYLCRMVEYFFKKKPYAFENGMYFFLVEV